MAISETARLERETEETRAHLEHTLSELRGRISPGQLLDQATGYLRNNSGRAFFGNLRDEVVRNPLPIALVGAGIAWIAISAAVGRRRNGTDQLDPARDGGETRVTAPNLAGDGGKPNVARRARQAAEGRVDDSRDAANDASETVRETASDLSDRLGTAYDETIGRAWDAAGAWVDDGRSAASEAGDSLREGARDVGERAADMYDQTVGGVRQVASKAAEYGRAARHAIEPNGTLMTFCREQPMLVAGLGIAIGAAIGAMLPASPVQTRIIGEASQKVRQRVTDVASQTLRSVAENGEEDSGQKDESSRKSAEPRDNEHRTNGDTSPSGAWSTGDSVDEIERGVRQGSRRPNTESEPPSAVPYADAASSANFGENGARQRN
jgi:Protein of unknown function (DUF3618)